MTPTPLTFAIVGKRTHLVAGFQVSRLFAIHGNRGNWTLTHLPTGRSFDLGLRTKDEARRAAETAERVFGRVLDSTDFDAIRRVAIERRAA